MATLTFQAEIALDVEVEVLGGHPGTRGRGGPEPVEADPAELELAVWLGQNGGRIDLAPHLPADVLEALRAEASDRLHD
jgi:hypothetical protein